MNKMIQKKKELKESVLKKSKSRRSDSKKMSHRKLRCRKNRFKGLGSSLRYLFIKNLKRSSQKQRYWKWSTPVSYKECSNSRSKKYDLTSAIPLVLIVFTVFLISSFFSSAQEKHMPAEVCKKQYKSILVREGDTLWEIAESCVEHKGAAFSEIQICVNEIKKINGLPSDRIFSGRHLIIPIYIE